MCPQPEQTNEMSVNADAAKGTDFLRGDAGGEGDLHAENVGALVCLTLFVLSLVVCQQCGAEFTKGRGTCRWMGMGFPRMGRPSQGRKIWSPSLFLSLSFLLSSFSLSLSLS